MRVRVWDPFYEIIQLQDRSNRLLRDGFSRTEMRDAGMPAVDVYEAKASFENGILRVEVPVEKQSEPKKLEIADKNSSK